METNIHTQFRSTRFSLREARMIWQLPPSANEQATNAIREAGELVDRLRTQEDVDAAADAAVTNVLARLTTLGGDATISARAAELLNARTILETVRNDRRTRDIALNTIRLGGTTEVANIQAETVAATKHNRARQAIVTHFSEIKNVATADWHNMAAVVSARAAFVTTLKNIDPAQVRDHADAADATKNVNMTDNAETVDTRRTEHSTFLTTAATGLLPLRAALMTALNDRTLTGAAREAAIRAAKDALTAARNTRLVHIKNKIIRCADGDGAAPTKRFIDADLQIIELCTQRSEINRIYFEVVRSIDGTTAPTGAPATGPSTGPIVAPAEVDAAINTFPLEIRTHLQNLRRYSVEGKPVTDPAVQASFGSVNTWYSGFTVLPATREGHWRNIVTAMNGTRYRVEIATPTTLRLVEGGPVGPTGPSTTPMSATELSAALPPLPAGLERPANRFFSEGLSIMRLMNDMGVLPEPLLRAMNSMNGREVSQLNRQLSARRTQLNQARTELTTADATTRPLIERRIRALEQDIAAREEQLRALGAATGTGDPETRRMMTGLLRMFMGFQRQGQGLGVMPWGRRLPTGNYGFDLYGLNNGGNLVMGHGARMHGDQFGYHPYGGASIVNYGPMYVNGATGGVAMGGGMMGAPGRLPFPPRPGMPPTGPFPGGGYVMGGGYFSGRKPSGSDSRPR